MTDFHTKYLFTALFLLVSNLLGWYTSDIVGSNIECGKVIGGECSFLAESYFFNVMTIGGLMNFKSLKNQLATAQYLYQSDLARAYTIGHDFTTVVAAAMCLEVLFTADFNGKKLVVTLRALTVGLLNFPFFIVSIVWILYQLFPLHKASLRAKCMEIFHDASKDCKYTINIIQLRARQEQEENQQRV